MANDVRPCGRTWDHEPHIWLSRDDRECPGVIASPINQQPLPEPHVYDYIGKEPPPFAPPPHCTTCRCQ